MIDTNQQTTMNNAVNNMSLAEKKAQYAAIKTDFEERRVLLDDWLDKFKLMKKLECDIYDIETPLGQKVVDMRDAIAVAIADLQKTQCELDSYRGRFNEARPEDGGAGGARLGRASAAPPVWMMLEQEIEKKQTDLQQKNAKLTALVAQLPAADECPRHKLQDNPAALCHTARSDGAYSMYAPNCNGCVMGIAM